MKVSLLAVSPFSNRDFQSFNEIPSSSKSIFLELETAATLTFILRFSFRNFFCWLICSMNFSPTFPTPITNKFNCFVFSSKKFSCRVFNAFLTSLSLITAEIFRSEAPCAIARIFTLFFPKVLNILPLKP